MPFTFSAGISAGTFSTAGFSFLKSSTFQPNIKQNNNVDNVNKDNINVNGNLDMGTNRLAYLNNVNVIPLDRRVHSLDNSSNNTSSGNLKNRSWYKSIFGRIQHTLSKLNYYGNDNDNRLNSNNNNSILDRGYSTVNTVENNNDGYDDGPIMMKSRNAVIRRGNTHDFYIITKGGSLRNSSLTNSSLTNSSLSDSSLTDNSLTNSFLTSSSLTSSSLIDDSLKPSRSSPNLNSDGIMSSSFFEKCAKTPRHFAKEPEVLGKVGRFTILRERADFDTTYFDQCHCQQKPCRFSKNGCSGNHPVPELLKENDQSSTRLSQQQAAMIAHRQAQMQMAYSYSNKKDSWSSSKSHRSSYSNNITSNNSNSLPSLQKYSAYPSMVSKATSTVSASPNSNPNSVIITHSSSSPNLVHLNQRYKIESVQNKNTSKNNNGRHNANIIVGGNSGKYPNPSTNNGSQCNNNTTVKKQKKLLLVNTEQQQQRSLSMPPIPTTTIPSLNITNSSSTPTTPTISSKFSISPNEPHTTINSHSGRKFEVEWNTKAKSSSSSSTSSTSSSDTACSPPSTISSVFSMASSPEKKSTANTLSRRCSTLSSKCGRFEVTVLSSPSSPGNHSLLNTSPHSTIGSVNSIISSSVDASAEPTKC